MRKTKLTTKRKEIYVSKVKNKEESKNTKLYNFYNIKFLKICFNNIYIYIYIYIYVYIYIYIYIYIFFFFFCD